jgi:AraC family transcriptional regulator
VIGLLEFVAYRSMLRRSIFSDEVDACLRSEFDMSPMTGMNPPSVSVTPRSAALRRFVQWPGLAGEVVQFAGREPFEYEFLSSKHLLIACERAIRTGGETSLDGSPPSNRRDFGRTLTFVPAGHRFRGSFVPRVLPRTAYIYIDPSSLSADPALGFADASLRPQLFFADAELWSTTRKLVGLIENDGSSDQLYGQTLGALLAVELVRLNRGRRTAPHDPRGGLATWQQRIVCDYIEANLDADISLDTLAGLARLSPTHFCRSFGRSLGIPPHRYLVSRRLERAKTLLTDRELSISEVAMASGFATPSSFATAFRKGTRVTPQEYRRSMF